MFFFYIIGDIRVDPSDPFHVIPKIYSIPKPSHLLFSFVLRHRAHGISSTKASSCLFGRLGAGHLVEWPKAMAKAATTIVPFLDAPIFKASMAPISGLAQMILETDPQK